jgi:antitoxin (DNA-binding transcriptional repressor) of toxin-antitoxin stability system
MPAEDRDERRSARGRAEHGEEIVIARAGKPVVKLVPYAGSHLPRTPGGWKGRVSMAAGLRHLPPDVAAAFRGEVP